MSLRVLRSTQDKLNKTSEAISLLHLAGVEWLGHARIGGGCSKEKGKFLHVPQDDGIVDLAPLHVILNGGPFA